MKNTLITSLAILLFSTPAWADELDNQLNGTSHDNGDGTYTIILQSDEGHVFAGQGINQADGTLLVTVSDSNGVTYRGLASNNDDEEYILTLNDVATGSSASGVLEEE